MKIYLSEDWHLQAKYRIAAYLVSPDLLTVNSYKHSRNPQFSLRHFYSNNNECKKKWACLIFKKVCFSNTSISSAYHKMGVLLSTIKCVASTVYCVQHNKYFTFSFSINVLIFETLSWICLRKTSVNLVLFVKEIFSGYRFLSEVS